ncbi:MAG TPA: XrtA/PEP-CTERM system histidine kinase PrsK [Rhodopila sp.]|nr:XrtA/PEP-CTERM system histidine kinase PrsK [Rhodopila sp.]
MYRRSLGGCTHVRTIFQPTGVLVLLVLSGCTLLRWVGAAPVPGLEIVGRIGVAVCGILLLENLYRNTPADSRWNINLLCVGLGSVFAYDLVLYADGALFRRLSAPLIAARAPVMILAAPLLALAITRCRRWAADIRISQDVTFHSFTLIGCGTFLLAVALIGEVLRSRGPEWGSVVETTLIFAAVLAVSVVVTSGSARSRIRGLVVENFFHHRYDYRKEWMRCIDALTAPEAFVALHKRVIRAAAEVVDSPAGALFVRPPRDVAFQWAGSWNMPAVVHPIPPGHPIVPLFRDSNWIVRIEDHTEPAAWFPDLPRAWIALPLNHFGTLIGFVVLARPRARFTLDREACDLLRVIGREIASRVAEQRAEQVVRQTRDLREYSQRFAFVIHDIKNVSGQLSMLMTNAEQHAGNPEFQRDMLTTVRAAVGKITRLLSRLEADRQERKHAIVTPANRIPTVVLGCNQAHRCDIRLLDRSAGAGAGIDPDAFDAVMTHLLNNAAEASPPGAPVIVELRPDAATLVIDIIDRGPGMPPEFVRDELFRPLRSTKGDGHGIGAFQARELLRDAGGDLLVLSRPSHGTTMRIILPRIRADLTELIEA